MESPVPRLMPPAPQPDRKSWARALVLGAPLVFALALIGLVRGVAPFTSWFFVFAWWSYILGLDGWVYLRRGDSMLLSRTRGFLLLLPWSTAFWLFFELVNLRLDNWYYVGLPVGAASRFLGIFVSFATVLPGIFETADLLATFRVGDGLRCNPERWRVTPERRRAMTIAGWAFLALPLLFPRYCYPLIWGATFLLLEPRLAGRNQTSLWSHFAAGRPAVPLRLFLAGAVCGLCWESWNFWASAKWIYTVPFFEELKLFEMPLLGFLGFPPFALECYTFARFLVSAGRVPEWEPGLARRCVSRRRQNLWALAAAAVSVPAILAVDQYLVRSTAPQIAEFRALSDADRERLAEVNIEDSRHLGRALASWEHGELLEPATLEALAREYELARLALMGHRGVAWLASLEVHDVAQLAAQDSVVMLERLTREGTGPGLEPTPPEVRYWIRRAKRALEH